MRCRRLAGDDADSCRVAELGQELFAVVPREAEGAYVGEADPGHEVANGCERRVCKKPAWRKRHASGRAMLSLGRAQCV